ncbi:MAG: hypothetical protein JXA42_23410 [Anaerolineales bacterium]|nr:hypothetical protein [Anaerolineales bacterium]
MTSKVALLARNRVMGGVSLLLGQQACHVRAELILFLLEGMDRNMNPIDQKARDIIGHLAYQLARGWTTFVVAKHVHEARSGKRINCAHYFFNTVEESCIESAILALSRVLIPHIDSINVQYLLNYSEQNHRVFPRADQQTIIDNVQRHRQQLASISSLIANIKEQRDRTVAHLDRKHVTNPSAVYAYPPLNYLEIESVFSLLLCIINTYSGYLVPSEDIRLDDIEPSVVDDMSCLVKLIEQDNARL